MIYLEVSALPLELVDGLLEVGQVHTVQQQVALYRCTPHNHKGTEEGRQRVARTHLVAVAILELHGFGRTEPIPLQVSCA